VDLAGSERNEDSWEHDAEQRKQCAEINSSLLSLKECVRLRAKELQSGTAGGGHIPFRRHKLTQLLRDAFVLPSARTVVIATVTPTATNTEHSVNTLYHASLMKGEDSDIKEEKVPVSTYMPAVARLEQQLKALVPPAKWSAEQVQAWVASVDGGRWRRYAKHFSGASTAGPVLVRFSRQRFAQLCEGNQEAGDALYNALQKQRAKEAQLKEERRKAQLEAMRKNR